MGGVQGQRRRRPALLGLLSVLISWHHPGIVVVGHNVHHNHDRRILHEDNGHHHLHDGGGADGCGFEISQESYLVDEARSVGLDKVQRRRRRQRRVRRRLGGNQAKPRQMWVETNVTDDDFENDTYNCQDLCQQCIEIEARVHLVLAQHGDWTAVVPHPTDAYERLLLQEQGQNEGTRTEATKLSLEDFSTVDTILALFQDNVNVLNDAFRETPFRFRFNATATRTLVNTEWTQYGSEFRTNIYEALASGDSLILDVFLVNQMFDRVNNSSATAMSSFAGEQLTKEGVVMRYDAVTGGGHATHSSGHILTHEVGHFLGLFHTFQKYMIHACSDRLNDLVDDTPVQDGNSKSQFDCTLYLDGQQPLPDTCPDEPGSDALFNYMNYVSNGQCWKEEGSFTCGQILRMHSHWKLFREHVSTCDDPETEMELEFVLLMDEEYESENIIRVVDTFTDEVLFHSYRDFTSILSNRANYDEGNDSDGNLRPPPSTVFFDLCVPRNHTYRVSIIDRQQNGFTNGLVQIFRDRILYARIEGDFGETAVVEIRAGLVPSLPFIITSPPGGDRPTVSTPSAPTTNQGSRPTPAPGSLPQKEPRDVPSTDPSVDNTSFDSVPSAANFWPKQYFGMPVWIAPSIVILLALWLD